MYPNSKMLKRGKEYNIASQPQRTPLNKLEHRILGGRRHPGWRERCPLWRLYGCRASCLWWASLPQGESSLLVGEKVSDAEGVEMALFWGCLQWLPVASQFIFLRLHSFLSWFPTLDSLFVLTEKHLVFRQFYFWWQLNILQNSFCIKLLNIMQHS